ncbi:MAG: hypothetical protein M3Y86_05060 [Verrucomicrobiota bacterium]|nr:hypothetical protein [Verrucomicrobiota bacterium]
MEQILFVVLVAIVALVRLAFSVAEKQKNSEAAKRAQSSAPANAPVTRAPAEGEEERMRRFFEALGVPAQTAPPPVRQRREVIPKTPRAPRRKILPVDPFPVPRGASLPPVIAAPPPIMSEPEPFPTEPVVIAPAPMLATLEPAIERVPAYEVRTVEWGGGDAEALVRQNPDQLSWATRLASPDGLRDAIILREIFGAPRSLQPLEQMLVH